MERTLPDDDSDEDDASLCQINHIGWPGEELIEVSKLLPCTPEREHTYKTEVVPTLEKLNAKPEPTVVEKPQVNGRYFYKAYDGVEYPVILTKLLPVSSNSSSRQLKTKNQAIPQCTISFRGYGTTSVVPQSKLLPATPKREDVYMARLAFVKQEKLAKKLTASCKKKKETGRKTAKRKSAKSSSVAMSPKKQEKKVPKDGSTDKHQKSKSTPSTKASPCNKGASGSRKRQKGGEDRYEPATDISNLPTEEDRRKGRLRDPGTHYVEKTRIVYIAYRNETIQEIADKFSIPVEKVVYDNRRKWGKKLCASSQLAKWTPVVIPSTWNNDIVKMHQSPH